MKCSPNGELSFIDKMPMFMITCLFMFVMFVFMLLWFVFVEVKVQLHCVCFPLFQYTPNNTYVSVPDAILHKNGGRSLSEHYTAN